MAAAVAGVIVLVGCTSDPEPVQPTVTPSSAYTAIVRWELEQTEPIVDADGNVVEPIIYLATGSGGMVDVRVQADVVSAIDDAAVIRFADDARDARDESLDQMPVKDDGIMLLIDEFEPDQAKVEARTVRYRSLDDNDAWILEVVATDDGATVTSANVVTE